MTPAHPDSDPMPNDPLVLVCTPHAWAWGSLASGDVWIEQAWPEGEPPLEFPQELLTQTANQRNRENTLLMAQTLFNDIYSRMVDLLMSLAVEHSSRTMVIPERITHQEIANRLGCSREMVSRLLKDLEKGQYISRRSDMALMLHPPLPVAW